jgi:multicomponent Na+:H+ antiporter subunit A
MALALLLTLLWAAAAPLLVRGAGRQAGWVLALGPVGLFAWFLAYLPDATTGAGTREAVSWVPTLGVELSFLLDGLSLLFALLITGLGTLIVVYAGRYLHGHRDLGRFFVILFAFLASMLGVVLADNLLLLFVFWEGTSLCSYLLVGFKHESEKTRTAALQALLITGGGGLALLTGVLLLGAAGGSFELSTLLTRGADVQAHPLYLPAFVLIAIGAFAKSAQVPFHFWLPNAMAAPTPVSAYLHSATMVKAGVYLLARLDPVLGGTGAWIWTLAVVGGATMLVGSIGALRHTDLKKVLAYSTLTALGTLVVLLGLSYDASIKAAIVFLLVHALYKSGLFLVAGSVEHGTGTRDLLQVSGLRSVLPWTALAAVLAGLSMAGLPPLFGFVGKELAYKAKLGVENLGWLLPTIAVTANALTVVAAGLIVLRPFFGSRRPPETGRAHEVPFAMWVGPVLVGAAGLLFGVAPTLMAGLVAPAVAVVAGEPVEIQLALWYGLNTALYLSVVTVVLGGAGYLLWPRVRARLTALDRLIVLGPARGYDLLLKGAFALGNGLRRFVEVSSVRRYLALLFGVIVALVGGTLLLRTGTFVSLSGLSEVLPHEWGLVLLIAAAALAAAWAQAPLVALPSLGVAGLGLALLYVLLSAPDLAMTQVLVEILLVVIALAVLSATGRMPRREPRKRRRYAVPLAMGVGGTVTLLLLSVLQQPFDGRVSDFFLTQSVPQGFGRNVVNVILVDFRALDTLGEIAVLAIAALGALVLLRGLTVAGPSLPSIAVPSLVLRTAARLLLALLILASLFMLWRGHNEPGGGFIGGLFAASAVVLYLLAHRRAATERLLRGSPRMALGVGLAIALGSGLVGVFAGNLPFLTGQWTTIGKIKLGTPLLFDIGVFIVVVGFTLTIILALDRVLDVRAAEENKASDGAADRRPVPPTPQQVEGTPSSSSP